MKSTKMMYIRVSGTDQNPDRQINKAKELGIEDRFIFVEKASGKNFDRNEYQAMIRVIREGDLIYLDSLDRLGRNYDMIIEQWQFITRELKADIVFWIMKHYLIQENLGKWAKWAKWAS